MTDPDDTTRSRPRRTGALSLTAAAGAAVLVAGAAIEMATGLLDGAVADTRREVRILLNLPKQWDVADRLPSAAGRAVVPCPTGRDPVVLAIGGQSNAANTNSSVAVRAPSAEVVTFHEGRCYASAEPMLGATGGRGSLWPALGDRLAAERGRPVVLLNGAVGGTEFTDWLDRRSGYLDALEARIAQAASRGFAPDLILWHQGETDAVVSSGYRENLGKLQRLTGELLDAAPGARLYLFRTSRCRRGQGGRPVEAMTRAQTHVAEADARIVAGMDTDALGDDFRWDGCHFNGRAREAIVEEVASDLLGLLDERG